MYVPNCFHFSISTIHFSSLPHFLTQIIRNLLPKVTVIRLPLCVRHWNLCEWLSIAIGNYESTHKTIHTYPQKHTLTHIHKYNLAQYINNLYLLSVVRIMYTVHRHVEFSQKNVPSVRQEFYKCISFSFYWRICWNFSLHGDKVQFM